MFIQRHCWASPTFYFSTSELVLGVLRQESRVIAESGAVAVHRISHHDEAFDEAVVVLEVRAPRPRLSSLGLKTRAGSCRLLAIVDNVATVRKTHKPRQHFVKVHQKTQCTVSRT